MSTTTTESRPALGTSLRIARRSAGMTQRELASTLGVESITVSRWERGVTSPSLPRLREISETTETPLADLVRNQGAPSAATAELEEIRAELRELRELVELIGRTVARLAREET